MEKYFQKRSQQFHSGISNLDRSPIPKLPFGLIYQFQERFQDYTEQKLQYKPPHLAQTPLKASQDPKWRFNWALNNPINAIPQEFPQFKDTMNAWGCHMRDTSLTVASMAAIGLGLDKKYFSAGMQKGFFGLSPTGVDLLRSKKGDVLAAFHHDFSMLTIHGKARYSGLYAWSSTGQKFLVTIPEGYLLLQAGKQLQWITGGYIKAGFHEVIYNQLVEQAKEQALKQNRIAWRVSSTMFTHMQGSFILEPHPLLASPQAKQKYPPISSKDYSSKQVRYLNNIK